MEGCWRRRLRFPIDGTPKLVNGQPVDTYTMDDIRGLAKVFTGWSWGNEGTPDLQDNRFFGNEADRKREIIPMQHYPKFHSPESKAFLGTTIAAGTPGPQALKTALDTIFNHPNVGPFLAQRLIQRLVTSNPSPAYVDRVAAVFNNNGKGVRGDLKAVVRAVLFDPEARDANALASAQFGKLPSTDRQRPRRCASASCGPRMACGASGSALRSGIGPDQR